MKIHSNYKPKLSGNELQLSRKNTKSAETIMISLKTLWPRVRLLCFWLVAKTRINPDFVFRFKKSYLKIMFIIFSQNFGILDISCGEHI